MSKLIAAKILPERTMVGEVQVEITWQSPLVARQDWKALHTALQDREIPTTTRTEIRPYANAEIAERAVAAMGGRLEVA